MYNQVEWPHKTYLYMIYMLWFSFPLCEFVFVTFSNGGVFKSLFWPLAVDLLFVSLSCPHTSLSAQMERRKRERKTLCILPAFLSCCYMLYLSCLLDSPALSLFSSLSDLSVLSLSRSELWSLRGEKEGHSFIEIERRKKREWGKT